MADDNNTNTSGFGLRKSDFNAQGATPINSSSTFDFVENGTNKKITLQNLLSNLGAVGTIVQDGAVTGTPVLDKQGSVNNIRNLENGPGVKSSISPENGITLGHNFISGVGGVAILKDPTSLQPTLRSISGGTGISVAASNGSVVISQSSVPTGSKVVVVNEASDFPAPVAGVRTLEPDTVYLIGGFIDVGSDSFVAQAATVVTGTSELVNGITSLTSLALFSATTGGDFSLSNLQLTVTNGSYFDFISPTPKTGKFLARSLILVDSQTVGIQGNFSIISFSGVLLSNTTVSGGTFTGVNGIGNFDTIVIDDFTGTLFDLGTSVFDLFNIENSSITSSNPANIILDGLANSGNISATGHAVVRSANVFGVFTNPGNILTSDLRWDFTVSNIFPSSTNTGYVSMPSNATATVIAVAATPVKVAGTWTVALESRFANDTTGKMTYLGTRPINASISVSCTVQKSGSGTDTFILYAAINGVVSTVALAEFSTDTTRGPNVSINAIIPMVTNDFLELFIENVAATNNVTITAANFVAAE